MRRCGHHDGCRATGVIAGPAVMRAQLESVAQAARLENVTVQVVPFAAGAYPGMVSTFVLLAFDGDPDIVYVEGSTGDQFLEGEAAKPYTLRLNGLRAAALDPDDSIAMIEDAAKALR